MFGLGRMSEAAFGVHHIGVAAPHPVSGDDAGVLKVAQNRLRRPFGDLGQFREIPKSGVGIAGDEDEEPRMVGEQSPRAMWLLLARWRLLNHSTIFARKSVEKTTDTHSCT